MISENYVELTTSRLEAELAALTEHLAAFQHSPQRHRQIDREIRLVAFELHYRNRLLHGQVRELEVHFQ